MSVSLLIDAIVRQTTVLVAQLATTGGVRAPLAHVADQVFLELCTELESQGVRRKLVADMFGLALRTYQRKVQRLQDSATDADRTLWEAMLAWIREQDVCARADVLRRFRHDDEGVVRAVLDDLVDNGLVYRRGRGDATMYRAAREEELWSEYAAGRRAGATSIVWVNVYKSPDIGLDDLEAAIRIEPDTLRACLDDLMADGHVYESAPGRYAATRFRAWYDERVGWEAAVFDHFQAMVTSLVIKLRDGSPRALPDDTLGGSTYTLNVHEGHPLRDEALALLRDTRERVDDLLTRCDAWNDEHGLPEQHERVTFYAGQSVREAWAPGSQDGEG